MIKTYNILKQGIEKTLKNYSNEELAMLYKQSQKQSIVAEIFCRNFNYWLDLSCQLRGIPYDERVSVILEKIHTGLLTYNFRFQTNLLTYIRSCIRNVDGGFITKSYYKNRFVENINVSFDDEFEEDCTFEDVIAADNSDLDTAILKLTINTDSSLTSKEKLLCNLIIDNPIIQMNELSQKLKVSNQYVWLIRKKLAKKLKICLCIDE